MSFLPSVPLPSLSFSSFFFIKSSSLLCLFVHYSFEPLTPLKSNLSSSTSILFSLSSFSSCTNPVPAKKKWGFLAQWIYTLMGGLFDLMYIQILIPVITWWVEKVNGKWLRINGNTYKDYPTSHVNSNLVGRFYFYFWFLSKIRHNEHYISLHNTHKWQRRKHWFILGIHYFLT